MIQKCPHCGCWCETEGAGILDRFGQGMGKSIDNVATALGGEDPGLLSTFLGGAIGTYTGAVRGAFKAVFGFKYEFVCPNCGFEWGTDDPADDQYDEFIEERSEHYSEMYSSINEEIEKRLKKDPQKAITYLDTLLQDPDYEDERAYLYRRQALIYINYLEDNESAIAVCNKGIELLEDDEWSQDESFLWYYKYMAEENLGRTWQARRDALYLYNNVGEDETIVSDEGKLQLEDVALKAFNEFDEEYSNLYLGFEYKDRKSFLVVPQYTNTGTTHVDVFHLSSIPKDITFPVGHPVENQLYIGHPYLPNLYLPYETYQYNFVEDRVREFCEIAQTLGATEITVEALNTSQMSKDRSSSRNISGGASYKERSANGAYDDNQNYSSVEKKYQALNFHQEYHPTEPPHLPEKMVWYEHEPRWQRLYNQRLKGILAHEERIETKNSQVVSGSELKDIKADVKFLIEAKGERTEMMEEKFAQEENAILSIKVKFAPLSELTGKAPAKAPKSADSLTPQEKEYLEEVKSTLEDGEIGPRERKSLERNRIRLGISEARAAQLEATVSAPQLTGEEKEYLEEVRAMLEDGEIGPRERKALERQRIRLGISEERAKQIESL